MKVFKRIDWRNLLERAGKTFVEAFIGVITAGNIFEFYDFESIKAAVIPTFIAALAAGLSAVWNMMGCLLFGGGSD